MYECSLCTFTMRIPLVALLGLLALVVPKYAEAAVAVSCPTDANLCKLPNCRCSDNRIPGNFDRASIPQIVVLSFDDGVSRLLYNDFYSKLITYKNPNNCPIGLTFFASHEYTDYTIVHELWRKGHEMAAHSISHRLPTTFWGTIDYNTLKQEMTGVRDILVNFARIPPGDVKGIRTPFLQVSGNNHFKMMKDNQFLWDSSMPSLTNRDLWPYTLDYKSSQQCQIGPTCPTDSFPGVWVNPMIDVFHDGVPCAMLDSCITGNATFSMLMENFNYTYYGNRVPLGLYMHAGWFQRDPDHWEGYLKFLDEIRKKDNVYILTMSQMLAWVRNPVISDLKNYPPWKTQCTEKSVNCQRMTCQLNHPAGGERWMTFCGNGVCPAKYPWVGNPMGNL